MKSRVYVSLALALSVGHATAASSARRRSSANVVLLCFFTRVTCSRMPVSSGDWITVQGETVGLGFKTRDEQAGKARIRPRCKEPKASNGRPSLAANTCWQSEASRSTL